MEETQTIDSSEPSVPANEANDVSEDQDMVEVQNPRTTADADSNSDSDSGSDSDDEAQQNLQIQTLEMELASNPSNYDAHVQYVKALRKQGDIVKLGQAREAMSELFPLSPEMWLEWAKDETFLTSGPGAFLTVEKIYERGVSDYLSVSLWCNYINFVQEHDTSVLGCLPDGILKARNLFERALTAAGLHFAEGSRIWEAYREFEQAIFLTVGENDNESREKQVQRIRNIFHRQLSVPLSDLTATLLAYKVWEAEQGNNTIDVNADSLVGIPSHVASAYQKALEMLNARTHHEENISRRDTLDSERLQQFLTYLKFEQSSGDPARVQILYERAIAEFPISSELWLDYGRYLDKVLKTSSIVKDIYCRATRNCPWVGELWVRRLLSLERGRASEEEISAVFEKSLQCTFSSFDEYIDIFLTRVDGLRRIISLDGKLEDGLDYAVIRDVFKRASDYLSAHLKNTESLLRIHSYWARLEFSLGKDLAAAREVWESLLKASGSMFEAWQGYISMEIQMGHINEARSLYKRCYSKRFSGTGSEDILHSWVRFEREYGSLEDFDHAMQKVTPRLEELQLFKMHQESKSLVASTDQTESSVKKNVREKRKAPPNLTDEQSPAKRHKEAAQNSKKAHGRQEAQMKDLAGASEVENDKGHATKPDSEREKGTKDVNPRKPKYNDQCTAFISNMSLQATEEDLHNFFNDVGGVVAIRILKDKFTKKSRGLAYVDFSDGSHLAAAVAKNKQKLLGKSLSVAVSDPNQGRKKAPAGPGAPIKHGDGGSHRRGVDNVQLKGKNTFALPRAVKPIGLITKPKPETEKAEKEGDEMPKSNDEFRKMFVKT